MLVRTRLIIALVCLALLGAACGGDPAPKVDPAPSVSTSAVTTPPSATTLTPTVRPIIDTPRSVVKRWIKLYNKLLTDGNGTDLRAISPTCQPCLATIKDVESIYSEGGYVHGGTYHLLDLLPYGRSQGLTGIRAKLRSDATRYMETDAGPVKSFPGGSFDYEFDLKRVRGRWVVDYETQLAT